MGSNRENQEYYDDEIDLIELFKKIWKWKLFVIGLTLIVTIATFFYIKSKPETYTVSADIVIGRIADFSIENESSIKNYMKKLSSIDGNQLELDRIKFDFNSGANILTLSSKTVNALDSFKIINGIVNIILKRHEDLYDDAIIKIKKSLVSARNINVITPKYVLRSYNFKSYLLKKAKIPEQADSKKLLLKTVVAFMASLFAGIFFVLFLDFLSSYRDENIDKKQII